MTSRIGNKLINLRVFFAVALVVVFCAVYYTLLTGQEIFTHDSIIWYGSFQYYLESISRGEFPYWDPYLMTGTYFYPNISLYGLLDPVVLLCTLLVKWFSLSPLTAYVYFRLYRLAVLLIGMFILFRHISRSSMGALVAVSAMLIAVIPGYFRAAGIVDIIYLTPITLYCLTRFMENPQGHRRYLYGAVIVLCLGLSMNYYIPTYFVFNLIAATITLLLLKMHDVKAVTRALRDKKMIAFIVAGAAVVLMMMAPPLSVMLKDMSPDGELFPMLRILQKNGGMFKKIMASEISSPAMSQKYTDEKGVFSSYGNMVQLLYPDAFDSVPFFAYDLMSEVPQYIGIIPFILALIGLQFQKSRYRIFALIMLIVMTANMFSFEGMSGKPFNMVQKMFNVLFPPLRMAEVREAFGIYFLFYLCMLVSLGGAVIFDGDLRVFLKEKLRPILIVCTGIVFVKILITAYYGGKFVFASGLDGLVITEIALFCALLYFVKRGVLSSKSFLISVVLFILVDFIAYAIYNERYILQDRGEYEKVISDARTAQSLAGVQYFRRPLVARPGIAFAESMLRSKGVLTYGNNHTLFATKRYYDLFTHLAPNQNIMMSSTLSPIVRFFADAEAEKLFDKSEALSKLSALSDHGVPSTLLLEEGSAYLDPRQELQKLEAYENINVLHPESLINHHMQFFRLNGKEIEQAWRDPAWYLRTPVSSVTITHFTENQVDVMVRNLVPGYLFYNDGWSKYWTAYDNGRQVPIYIANYNSKAVRIDPGKHDVSFVFSPRHYKTGLFLYYLGTLIAVTVIILFLSRREKTI